MVGGTGTWLFSACTFGIDIVQRRDYELLEVRYDEKSKETAADAVLSRHQG